MRPDQLSILPLRGIPRIKSGDDLSVILAQHAADAAAPIQDSDVLVVAQKIVSKAEGRFVELARVQPSKFAVQWAERYGKDPRVVEVALSQSVRIVRMDRGVLICETAHGFVCANAGVDASNVEDGTVTLLPQDPDGSARKIRAGLARRLDASPAVIISDTFGRPWRQGLVNVAIGVAGLDPLDDLKGKLDWLGRPLKVTVVAVADELAAAAELVMSKDAGIPAALIRGASITPNDKAAAGELIRPADQDLFR